MLVLLDHPAHAVGRRLSCDVRFHDPLGPIKSPLSLTTNRPSQLPSTGYFWTRQLPPRLVTTLLNYPRRLPSSITLAFYSHRIRSSTTRIDYSHRLPSSTVLRVNLPPGQTRSAAHRRVPCIVLFSTTHPLYATTLETTLLSRITVPSTALRNNGPRFPSTIRPVNCAPPHLDASSSIKRKLWQSFADPAHSLLMRSILPLW
jgi:hypothetical protein